MEWKICTYPRIKANTYLISEDGAIYNRETKKVRRPTAKNSSGYIHSSFQTGDVNTSTIYVCIHRIVAWEYCKGYSELKHHVNHKNGDKSNNHYTNLEWCTPLENIEHSKYVIKTYRYPDRNKLGKKGPRLASTGINNSNVKYNEFDVRRICEYIESGMSNKSILNKFGYLNFRENTSLYHLIINIRKKKNWTHISSEYNISFKYIINRVQRLSKT